MAHFPLKNCMIIISSSDLSSDMNNVTIQRTQEGLSDDTFSSTKSFLARMNGLQDGVFGMAGLVELTNDGQDEKLSAGMSLSNTPILVSLLGGADFARAKFGLVQSGQYQSGGTVGGRAEWTADGRISNYILVEGNLMTASGAKTGTFNGTWRELGAVSATQKLYSQIHATAKDTFTSAIFKVQSADDAAGTNATIRITHATITDLTSEFATPVAGAITQSWWRLQCTAFTGTSLTVHSAVGIF